MKQACQLVAEDQNRHDFGTEYNQTRTILQNVESHQFCVLGKA